MREWQPFYDPSLYEMKVGPGGRVRDVYLRLIGTTPLDCLEFGCGTGEIAIALAGQGHRVTGVDCSSEMLNRAKHYAATLPLEQQERLSWREGDMTSINLKQQFDRVLLTNELINHLRRGEQLVDFFALCRQHIKSGGSLLLDIPLIDLMSLSSATQAEGAYYVHGVFALAEDGTSVWVAEQIHFDPSNWNTTKTFEYKYISANGTVERTTFRELRQRAWTTQEVQFALKLAGLAHIKLIKTNEDASHTFMQALVE